MNAVGSPDGKWTFSRSPYSRADCRITPQLTPDVENHLTASPEAVMQENRHLGRAVRIAADQNIPP